MKHQHLHFASAGWRLRRLDTRCLGSALVLVILAGAFWFWHPQPVKAQEPSADAKAVLTRFMDARIDRRDQEWQALLSDDLRTAPLPGDIPLAQVSNPCWYRYEVLEFTPNGSNRVAARVRIYQHFWPGDNGGGLPSSFAQEVGLVQTADGWRVDQLSPMQAQREEPDEPHGPTSSACNVGRQPAVWLTGAGQLPAAGGLADPVTAVVAALGSLLLAGGLFLRRSTPSTRLTSGR